MIKNSKGRIITCAACIAGFCLVFLGFVSGSAEVFDDIVRESFYSIRNDTLTGAVKIVTYAGSWQTVTALCLILLTVRKTRLAYGIPVSVGALFVTGLNKLIKHLVERERPEETLHLISEGGFSFPSGHSITSVFVYGLLIYLVRTNVKDKTAANVLTAVLFVLALCIGPSRVYLGVHYPTDVLAGWCLGIALIAVAAEIIERIKLKKKRTI